MPSQRPALAVEPNSDWPLTFHWRGITPDQINARGLPATGNGKRIAARCSILTELVLAHQAGGRWVSFSRRRDFYSAGRRYRGTAYTVRAGAIVNFISESVMVGFKCGVALFLASTQLPKLFGIHGAHGDFWENSAHFLGHLHETNPVSLTIGAAALAALMVGKILLKNKPVALFVVVGGIIASTWFGLDQRGVKLLGEIPKGLPAVGLPAVYLSDLNALLPLAFSSWPPSRPLRSAAPSRPSMADASMPTRSSWLWPHRTSQPALAAVSPSAVACPSRS